ncbi:hypothetical protein HU200_005048 [Digitaria exilis]|uniref:F-box domain-containing protein n=1 Tax=Digitaria exilis TaxID=1010633 RepID=A0A835FUP8_9POAL|nr:hypothetical protein HU200_005048 [Digitaria exilis]
MAADRVCHTWRAAARDEPSLWRRITMRGHEGIARRINRCGMACEAVRRSAGRCEAFCGEYAGDDGFLIYLAQQSPCLRSLRLISCNGVTDIGFTEVVRALPLLEELELSLCDNVGADGVDEVAGADGVYEVAGELCPQLNHFRLSKRCFNNYRELNMDKDALEIASCMHSLRSLQLCRNAITNEGLESILDSCSHLESLDICHCFNIDMSETLLAKCARIKTIKLSDDAIHACELQAQSPGITAQSPDCDLWRQRSTNFDTYLSHY